MAPRRATNASAATTTTASAEADVVESRSEDDDDTETVIAVGFGTGARVGRPEGPGVGLHLGRLGGRRPGFNRSPRGFEAAFSGGRSGLTPSRRR